MKIYQINKRIQKIQISKRINLDNISKNHLYLKRNEMIYLNQNEWQQMIAMLDDKPSKSMNALLAKGYLIINHQKME